MPRRLLVIMLLLLGALLPGARQAAAQAPVRSIPVGDHIGALSSDGRFVVWLEGLRPQRLYAASLSDGRPIVIADGLTSTPEPNGGPSPALDAGTVVWVQRSGDQTTLLAKKLPDGPTTTVASGPEIGLPAISGTIVTWWENPSDPKPTTGTSTLFVRDLATSDPPRVLAQVASTHVGFSGSAVNGRWVVWSHGISSTVESACWQVSARPLDGGSPRVIHDEPCHRGDFLLAGDTLVDIFYQETYPPAHRYILREQNLDTRRGRSSTHGRPIGVQAGDGRYNFWAMEVPGTNDGELWGYDRQTESMFQVPGSRRGPTRSLNPLFPVVADNLLCWLGVDAAGNSEIIIRPIAELLPSAPRPAPSDSALRYFPETRHSLAGTFRGYWEQRGGLSIFGYPLTEAFTQRSRDMHQNFPVQYLERQRFELHEEHAGTPYEVLLGRLGAEELERRGRNWKQEPKASPSAPHYFRETGHAVAPEFWAYWSGHGLEFGDPGVSHREALALFGYPLTEPAIETNSSGDRVLTQWFERARFEYHPGNAEPFKVLLGRLAAESMDGWGWR